MQTIAPVTSANLLARGQQPLLKFEIYDCCCWVDLTPYVIANSLSISTAGAEMTPNPVAASWSVRLFNKNGRFDPDEDTYAPDNEYLRVGRKIKISIGATYGGIDYYWRRIYGFMEIPEFSIDNCEVTIRGFDNMQFLVDTKLKELDNYFGTSATFNSVSSEGSLGAEQYVDEDDAMEIGGGEANNVANWTPTNCTFVSFGDVGGGSTWVGRLISTAPAAFAKNPDVETAVKDTEYKVTFKGIRSVGTHAAHLQAIQTVAGTEVVCGMSPAINTGAYATYTFYFTALADGAVILRFLAPFNGEEYRIDEISIKVHTAPVWYRYELPEACLGVHYATLDGEPVWPGKQKGEGWYYDSDTRNFYFDEDKRIEDGIDNLIIHYYTVQVPENVVADILVRAGLYSDQAEALAAMIYTATGITIDKVWFDAGSTCLDAVRMLCERCNYRFYFNYSGRPVFKPTPDLNIAMGSLDYDNLVGSFFEGETITATSGATAVVKSDDGSTLELVDCSGCFNDNEQIVGGVSAATADVYHPVGVVGVDKFVKNGAFVLIADDPPTSWTPSAAVTLDTVVNGQVGNCMRVLNNGAPNRYAFQYMTVIIGRIYRVSVYAKQGTADAKVYVGSSGVNPTNSDYMDETEDAGAWTEFTTTFVATTTSVNITCWSIGVDVRQAYFDEITLYDLTGADFDFNESQITNIRDYEDRNEIKNRIVIEGIEQALPEGAEETKPSKFKGEVLEVASANKYGEHTWTIRNHLFQDQATIDAYCAIYLATFKDPKWYTTFETPFNPVPLVKGDTITWRKQYEIGGTPIDQRGIIRDIQINDFDVIYKIEKVD